MIRIIISLCVITFGLCSCAPRAETPVTRAEVHNQLTTADAIRLARQACQGRVEVPVKSESVVTETNGNYVVTFPQPYQEGVLHGDIYARVVIEKKTGKVVDMESSE